MKKSILFLVVFSALITCTLQNAYAFSNGNLSVSIFSPNSFFGVAPGDTVSYFISYSWDGESPASNVQLKSHLSNDISLISTFPVGQQSGNELTWDFASVSSEDFGFVTISGIVNPNLPLGSFITSSVQISGDVTGNDPEDDTASVSLELIDTSVPDLWVMQWGLLESLESGYFLTAEKDVTATFEITYFNFSLNPATGVTIVDELPEGLEYVSAEPAPSLIEGNKLTWNLGTLITSDYGTIQLNLRPTVTGNMQNTVVINSELGDRNPVNNTATFTFTVVNLIQPVLLKPKVSYGDNVLMMGSNPKFEGLAKAGAKVTLYEGDSLGFWGDLTPQNTKEIMSTIAGPDRRWEMHPTTLTESKTYHLYIQAELNGEKSAPFFNMWLPFKLRIEPVFDLAGFDFDNFVVGTGGAEYHPGALGGQTSGVPDEDLKIVKQFKAPESILTDHSLWANHKMKLVITENGETYEEDLPVFDVQPVTVENGLAKPDINKTFRFIYVHKGFGPGAKVEVWCLPEYYDDDGNLVLVGLIWVKCHEILIDPAGYVYDVDIAGSSYEWPEIPPDNSLITNATVTTLVRTGDDSWEKWNAEETGQVNPQVTDETTEDRIKIKGYFAFYVPSGQYKVFSTAPGYADYTSPILTVIEAPVFHNVGMKRVSEPTSVREIKYNKEKPELFVLDQNYPNPFNPYTTISYSVPTACDVTLKIYNIQGKEVGTLINSEHKGPGKYLVQFDGSSLASGVYLYQLTAGKFASVKKFTLLK